MPNEQAHIELANRNKATLRHLLADKAAHAEWIATVAFYRAVHLVEAIFAIKGGHGGDHGKRHDRLKKAYPNLWGSYRLLWSLSTIARYMKQPQEFGGKEYTSFLGYLNGQDVQTVVADNLLLTLESKIRSSNFLSPASCKALGLP